MVAKKRPEGAAWDKFVEDWYTADYVGKIKLAKELGVTYDTAKHFISDSGATRKAPQPDLLPGLEPLPSTIPVKITLKKGVVAVLNDTHIPFHDPEVLQLVERFLAENPPDILIYNGDMIDFYQLSKYDKDPARISLMQKEVDTVCELLDRHAKILPDVERYFIVGTHERRMQSFLWSKAQALSSLRCLTIDELFGLNERGITKVDFEQGVIINDVFLVLHGDIASIHSSYTAKRLYEKHGGCGMAGHTHREGSYYKRDRFGTWGWWENGCLCSLNPDWIQNPNWVQGLSLVHFTGQRFHVEQIPIIDGKFVYGGKKYE